MPIASAVPSQSVEEILSSIRQAIAEDEARRGRAAMKPISSAAGIGRPSATGSSFTSANDDDDDWETDLEADFDTRNVIDLAIEKAIDGVTAALNDMPKPVPQAARDEELARMGAGPLREERRPEARPSALAPPRPLLSARSGAAVAASFDDLARNVATLTPAQVREMAQEMLRPMLKSWLDDNLPSVVERLVRDEIERVSRAR